MKKLTLFLAFTTIVSVSLYAQSTPWWMLQSNWVSYYDICQTQNAMYNLQSDCSRGTMVTDTMSFQGNIYWAGEITSLYYDEGNGRFTDVRIRVNSVGSESNYYCDQELVRDIFEIKDYRRRSPLLKGCP